jgi:hypothetical protein
MKTVFFKNRHISESSQKDIEKINKKLTKNRLALKTCPQGPLSGVMYPQTKSKIKLNVYTYKKNITTRYSHIMCNIPILK